MKISKRKKNAEGFCPLRSCFALGTVVSVLLVGTAGNKSMILTNHLIPRHWKDQQTPFVFSSTVHELHRRKVLRSWTCRVSALPVCCETQEISSENYTSKHKLPFPQFFFLLSVRLSVSLSPSVFLPLCCEPSPAAFRGSDAVHLGCSLTCSTESKCLAGETRQK